ncbi:3-dehydro-L-gulonate 2-dehydrogenase [Alkalibacter rhizosphaerae]|uniref:3-dehydro-L-gulonate 2-dehydrogenase n=1 Tax=Alkalibacter rhizosphaerae TaxID=2815577 RepID=A0A974XJ45_9FIRM|nr:3-dehydro-L-gulonate 2-dehydrogenase [Alkalibacter rhizosphaerae]QSX09650.1 3-dehydro-L-gulonate 2-dehydrogenase [Alkalibacter rhizosphaerae]
MRIKYEDMVKKFESILIKKGLSLEMARKSAENFANNSADGVYSHGVNRFPRVISYIDKGYIDVKAEPTVEGRMGGFERWNGNLAMGNTNAVRAMERAIELAKECGIGIVALGNTNHWMRGGTFGWQAADAGMIGMCWTNTMPNMPAWGTKDRNIGNNPFIMAIPRSNKEHVVVDCAMAQFSYGKIEETRMKGQQLPVVGGFDKEGKATTDPAAIEETWRVLPIGFWKGSGLSIAFDLIAAVLSGANSTTAVGKKAEDEYGLSQIFIAIDPEHMSSVEITDAIIDEVIESIKESEKAEGTSQIFYPGEMEIKTRRDNMENGIPVLESVWESIQQLEA